MKRRVFVLGIDGVPYSLINKLFADGGMNNLYSICKEGSYRRMKSVYPTVSSVAWTTYSTGVNPGMHSIFGFIDRKSDPFSIYIPLSTDRKVQSLWKYLSRNEKQVIVINVPLTYPPEEVHGIIASGFLCSDINKLCYPATYNRLFESKGYIIDVNAWKARENKRNFIDDLFKAKERRFEITFELMEKETWDLYQLHIMETDRLLHFFWEDIERGGDFSDNIMRRFFELLDDNIGKIQKHLNDSDSLIILSDHGFCSVKSEVELNIWLEREGLLIFEPGVERKLPNYHKDSICFSLIPGRIFINLEGREENGTVTRGDYKEIRAMIKDKLLELRNPDTKERIIDRVFYREEIYSGPYTENAADIIAHPFKGYDLKARLDKDEVFNKTNINGMHTYDDAFICSDNIEVSDIQSIEKVRDRILSNLL